MKKITAIIGSPIKERSNTGTLVKDFLEMVKSFDNTIQYEVIILGEKNVAMCKGCWSCTQKGSCVIIDDLQELQEKLLTSDLIILGSPVYVQHVSAQFKAFTDRLFIWFHTLRLIGKPALTAITTSRTGIRPTEKYLNMILFLLGTIPIGHLRGIAYRPGEFPQRDQIKRKYKKLARKTALILSGQEKVRPKVLNRYYFWGMKMKAKHGGSQLPFENEYWKKKGWFNKSFCQAAKI
ncbi:MAG: flavodoxin family protein [bacterium]|nr:flavodoxin family protein [bacterium]MDD5755955.1 flavodoxin family protein [bacterium]